MKDKNIRGKNDCPLSRSSTDHRDGETTSDDSAGKTTRDQPGPEPSSDGQTAAALDCFGDPSEAVLDFLAAEVTDTEYFKSRDIADATGLSPHSVAQVLRGLDGSDDPVWLSVERWSSNTPTTWRFEREVATDGGCTQLKFAPEPRQTLRVAADNDALAATVRYSRERPIVQAGERLDLVAAETGDEIGEARVARTVETPVYRALDYINNHCAAYSTRRIGRLIGNLNEYYEAKIGPETDVVVIFLERVRLDAASEREAVADGGHEIRTDEDAAHVLEEVISIVEPALSREELEAFGAVVDYLNADNGGDS